MSARRLLPRFALLLLLVAAVGWAASHHRQLDLATLDARLGALGPWAPAGYVVLYALGTVAFVPGNVSFVGRIGTEILARLRRRRGNDRVGVSFRSHRAVAGSRSHGCCARSRRRRRPLQPWPGDDAR